ncbi:GNAT family N-acetyltransferase [Sphingomonas sp. LT1P40]|uniref:GNAT family N-acetyltransferase n=1 Tax=Alteristakelama amylovorans TaxID=3096166 RepID=UPI002FCC62F4
MNHPLDRPIWNALNRRQAGFAVGDARAMRFRPDVNILAAAADGTPENLAALTALVPPGGAIATIDRDPLPIPPGLSVRRQTIILQMVAAAPVESPRHPEIIPLNDDDAPEMLALATLTEPGPFLSATHRLGGFVGIRRDGRLIAMAGERNKLPGLTEVSAVCTHPDYRGQGLAAIAMRAVIDGIVARGETPFLHSYPDNHSAIAVYRKLGFEVRAAMTVTFLERQA